MSIRAAAGQRPQARRRHARPLTSPARPRDGAWGDPVAVVLPRCTGCRTELGLCVTAAHGNWHTQGAKATVGWGAEGAGFPAGLGSPSAPLSRPSTCAADRSSPCSSPGQAAGGSQRSISLGVRRPTGQGAPSPSLSAVSWFQSQPVQPWETPANAGSRAACITTQGLAGKSPRETLVR